MVGQNINLKMSFCALGSCDEHFYIYFFFFDILYTKLFIVKIISRLMKIIVSRRSSNNPSLSPSFCLG